MKCEKLFEVIDSLYEEYLDVWEAICNIESPTRCKEGVDAAAKLLTDMARARGWLVETVPCEKAGDAVCITLNPDAEGAPISISGHLDTVHPIGSFGIPAVRRDAQKITAPVSTIARAVLSQDSWPWMRLTASASMHVPSSSCSRPMKRLAAV